MRINAAMRSAIQDQVLPALCMILMVVGGVGAVYYFGFGDGAGESVTLDSATGCRTDSALDGHIIILLDTTDPLDDLQQAVFRAQIDSETRGMTPYEKLSVYAINAKDSWRPRRLFGACAPKKGIDARGMAENPRLLEVAWKREFGVPLDRAIREEISRGPQAESPIIESIFAVSMLPDFSPNIPRRRLVVISDFLQHTALLSSYSGASSFEAFRSDPTNELLIPDLHEVGVVLRFIVRPEEISLQSAAFQSLWESYFQATGAQANYVGVPLDLAPNLGSLPSLHDVGRR